MAKEEQDEWEDDGFDEESEDRTGEEDLDEGEEGEEPSWEKIAEDPELVSRLLESLGGVVPSIFKRVAVSGVGNLLLSEDGLRTLLSENKKLPKEAVSLLVGQADVMRREVLRIISKEIRIFLEDVDFGGEIAKILTSVSFEVKTEIRFIPNDQSVKAQVKNKVKAKRSKDGKEIDLGEDGEESEELDEPAETEGPSSRERAAGHIARKLRWGRRKRDTLEDKEDEE